MTITRRALFSMLFAAPLAKVFAKTPTSPRRLTVHIDARCEELIRGFEQVKFQVNGLAGRAEMECIRYNEKQIAAILQPWRVAGITLPSSSAPE